MKTERVYLEFFAGGGMVRAGLGENWRCLFANDLDPAKCAAYRENFGGDELVEADVAALGVADLPRRRADLAWASFPCQDLSLAGQRAGLAGERSGLFFSFLSLIRGLADEGRPPRLLVAENVAGLLTSRRGEDFAAVAAGFASAGYRVSALLLNAKHFTPQSRPRLFVFGFAANTGAAFIPRPGVDECTPLTMIDAVAQFPPEIARSWRWLAPRPAKGRNAALIDIVDLDAKEWRKDLGDAALRQMSGRQRAVIDEIRRAGARRVGAAFRRIRIENGERVQRLEARFDGLAGCLRTPAGGSSRQMLLLIDRGRVKARLLSPREAARLMGLSEDYVLPLQANAALKLCGDGVAVPVVRWIAEEILEPALAAKAEAA